VVGGAQYVATDEHRAEVRFSAADKLQGRGPGSLLFAEDYPSAPWVRIPEPPLLAVPEHLVACKGKGLLAAFSGFEADPSRPILPLTTALFHHAAR
jgi:hypothetical protein